MGLDNVMIVGGNELAVVKPVDRRRWSRTNVTLYLKFLSQYWILIFRRVDPLYSICNKKKMLIYVHLDYSSIFNEQNYVLRKAR